MKIFASFSFFAVVAMTTTAFSADFSMRPPTTSETYSAGKSSPYQSVVEAVAATTAGRKQQEDALSVTLTIKLAVAKNIRGIVRSHKGGREIVRVIIGEDTVGIGEPLPPISLGDDAKGKSFGNLFLDRVTLNEIILRSGNSGENINVRIPEEFKRAPRQK
jgi:hypothetical protein